MYSKQVDRYYLLVGTFFEPRSYRLTLIQLQDLEQSIRAGHCNVALLFVPGNAVELDIVGYGNLSSWASLWNQSQCSERPQSSRSTTRCWLCDVPWRRNPQRCSRTGCVVSSELEETN